MQAVEGLRSLSPASISPQRDLNFVRPEPVEGLLSHIRVPRIVWGEKGPRSVRFWYGPRPEDISELRSKEIWYGLSAIDIVSDKEYAVRLTCFSGFPLLIYIGIGNRHR